MLYFFQISLFAASCGNVGRVNSVNWFSSLHDNHQWKKMIFLARNKDEHYGQQLYFSN